MYGTVHSGGVTPELMNIDDANKKLDRVKIRATGNKLYLRATLPLKPGQGKGKKQQDIKTGCDNNAKGISKALGQARKLESQICDQTFDWVNWGVEPPDETAPEQTPENIESLIERFTQEHWHRTEKTPNTEYYFQKSYLFYLDRLPIDEPITPENLKETLTKWPPEQKAARKKAYTALNALAKFAGVPVDLSPYRIKYKPIPKKRPNDDFIFELIDNLEDPGHKWILGIMATYGIRNHEVFFLDLEKVQEPPHILQVTKGKTGPRIVYPIPDTWVIRWQLWERHWPANWKIDTTLPHAQLGRKITSYLSNTCKLDFSPYAFRHRYAMRGSSQFTPQVMSKWMGHSLTQFFATYLSSLQEEDFTKIWLTKFGKTREEIREE